MENLICGFLPPKMFFLPCIVSEPTKFCPLLLWLAKTAIKIVLNLVLWIHYKSKCYTVSGFSCKMLELQKQATHVTREAGKLSRYHGVTSYNTADQWDTSNCLSLSMN